MTSSSYAPSAHTVVARPDMGRSLEEIGCSPDGEVYDRWSTSSLVGPMSVFDTSKNADASLTPTQVSTLGPSGVISTTQSHSKWNPLLWGDRWKEHRAAIESEMKIHNAQHTQGRNTERTWNRLLTMRRKRKSDTSLTLRSHTPMYRLSLSGLSSLRSNLSLTSPAPRSDPATPSHSLLGDVSSTRDLAESVSLSSLDDSVLTADDAVSDCAHSDDSLDAISAAGCSLTSTLVYKRNKIHELQSAIAHDAKTLEIVGRLLSRINETQQRHIDLDEFRKSGFT